MLIIIIIIIINIIIIIILLLQMMTLCIGIVIFGLSIPIVYRINKHATAIFTQNYVKIEGMFVRNCKKVIL